jgi:hypothetical protein
MDLKAAAAIRTMLGCSVGDSGTVTMTLMVGLGRPGSPSDGLLCPGWRPQGLHCDPSARVRHGDGGVKCRYFEDAKFEFALDGVLRRKGQEALFAP